jgi:hypothetical protein
VDPPARPLAGLQHIAYWTDLARLLERGLFDGLFIADIVGVYDVYQGNTDLTLRETIQLPVNDPLLLVSAMAAVTRHLGFGVTANLTYEAPFLFARRMSTLDHEPWPRGLEHRHRLPRQRRARHGPARTAGTRPALRPRRRIPGSALQALGRQLGRRRRARDRARRVYADPAKVQISIGDFYQLKAST